MKSLEILEIYLKIAKEEIEEDKVKNAIINNLSQIKSDLEVLEILRNYLFIETRFNYWHNDYVDGCVLYLSEKDDDENCDDFHKVKQWLEENDE